MKDLNEIEETRNRIHEYDESRYPAMSYEQGLADALDWVMSTDDSDLLEE